MRNRTFVKGSRHLLLASFAAASGAALAGCVGAEDAGSELLGEAQQAATVCVTLKRTGTTGVIKDAMIQESLPKDRQNDANMYAGAESNGKRLYSLIGFDLSSIPADAVITSADLFVHMGSAAQEVMSAHRITTAWEESTVSWNTHAEAWVDATKPEGERSNLGTLTASAGYSYSYHSLSLTALVQSWVNGTYTNHGILFEQTTNRTHIRASENAALERRPYLEVCYDSATGTGSTTTTSSSTTASSSSSTTASSSSSTTASSSSSTTASSSSSTTTTTTSGSGGEGGSGGGTGGSGGVGGGGGGVPGPPISCASNTPGAGENCGVNGNDDCCSTLPVPGGTFNRLNNAGLPATVSDFYLDKYTITVGRFRQYIAQTGGPTQANPPPAGSGAHPKIPNSGWDPSWNSQLAADTSALKSALICDPYGWPSWSNTPGAKEHKPIVCANWFELFAFCAWDGGRMPTQAEINYASAGGDEQRIYPWGGTSVEDIEIDDASWCCQGDGSVAGSCKMSYPSLYPCSQTDLTDVGKFPNGAGRWGHMDLAGNAYKATRDGSDIYQLLTPCNDCSRLDNNSVARFMHGGSFLAAGFKQTTDYQVSYASNSRRYYVTATCARDL
ncbi:DNRLRE domain-containing protein [Sorangium sp. So ce590]|uniref:DNRLRE domain-containing protein n=1 Tax=Sorangium sp. So ce590 TaxID=3133317 RepID=UPI003F61755F